MQKHSVSKRCCFCGSKIEGYGNNPWPVAGGNARCCDRCNDTVVIPARLFRLMKKIEEEKENG